MNNTTGTSTRAVAYVRVPHRPNPLAIVIVWWLEAICSLTGHVEGCLLLNSNAAGRPGRLWHRLVGAAQWASLPYRFERLP